MAGVFVGEAHPHPSQLAIQVLSTSRGARGGACGLRGAPWSPASGQCPHWGSLVLRGLVTCPPQSERGYCLTLSHLEVGPQPPEPWQARVVLSWRVLEPPELSHPHSENKGRPRTTLGIIPQQACTSILILIPEGQGFYGTKRLSRGSQRQPSRPAHVPHPGPLHGNGKRGSGQHPALPCPAPLTALVRTRAVLTGLGCGRGGHPEDGPLCWRTPEPRPPAGTREAPRREDSAPPRPGLSPRTPSEAPPPCRVHCCPRPRSSVGFRLFSAISRLQGKTVRPAEP